MWHVVLTCLADVISIVFVTDGIVTIYYDVDVLADVMPGGNVPMFVIVAVGSLLPMADVIATVNTVHVWQMLLPRWLLECPLWVWFGRCYSQSGRFKWPLGQCCNFNSDVLCRTSCHTWGKWYLPMFLFRDGSLTLMNRASLIALVRFWSSRLLWWSCWCWYCDWRCCSGPNIREGAFWCSLNLSAKVLADSPMYSSSYPF